jgi:phosphatidylserine/phosphatidylglycerophosphate/cardiolipin synthase-like enzyme
MRKTKAANGLAVTAYAGSTGVQLAWDLDEAKRTDLLGFAIRRYHGTNKTGDDLRGGITFEDQVHAPGQFLSTFDAPIQAFRWGDYTVYPGTTYRYEIVPRYADPDWHSMKDGESVTVSIRTEPLDGRSATPPSIHTIAFNRAVAASQAYERRFDDSNPGTNPAAFNWLTRDLDDVVLDYFDRALDDTWALDVVIYEYELEEIRAALRAARGRGVVVRVVFHDRQSKKDTQTPVNEAAIKADQWKKAAKGRLTSAICHDKTVVLSKLEGGVRKPAAVLTGSTNWTLNGLSYQANVAHVVNDSDVAGQFLALFEQLWAGADPSATKTWIDANNPLPAKDAPLGLVFSPRSKKGDLKRYVELINGAQRSLIFATAFDLDDTVEDALLGTGDTVLRFGLQNSASRITGYNRERATFFTAKGRLTTAPPGFRAESYHGQDGNLLVHLKTAVLDFDTDNPTVITGSQNFSGASSGSNDENALVIRGDLRVADVYMVELFRLFDHYKSRYKAKDESLQPLAGNVPRREFLDETDGWSAKYYDPSDVMHVLERTRLAHPA